MGKSKISSATAFAHSACKAFLGLEPSYSEPLSESGQSELISMASASKASGFILSGIKKGALPSCNELVEQLSEIAKRNLLRNLASMAQARKAVAIIQEAGTDVLVIKGPFRTYEVFETLDMRGSGDADLLVRQVDYRRAGEALCRAGFLRGVPENSKWWHDYLGESPFVPKGGGTVVDLHHRIQQPGAPAPKHLDPFFDSRTTSALAGSSVFVLSETCALVVAYLEFSKTIRSGEPWIANAVEITISKNKLSHARQSEFRKLVTDLELTRLVRDLDARTDELLKLNVSANVESAVLNSAFSGTKNSERMFHRLRLQWSWAQYSGARRFLHFIDSVRFRIWSDMVRRFIH